MMTMMTIMMLMIKTKMTMMMTNIIVRMTVITILLLNAELWPEKERTGTRSGHQ